MKGLHANSSGTSNQVRAKPSQGSGFWRSQNDRNDRSHIDCPGLPALTRSNVAAFLLLCAFASGAVAQTNPVERDVKVLPGRDARVGVYTSIRPDCTSGPLPAIRLASAPAHGVVSVKRATLKATNVKQCLAIEVPAFVAFYRATQNYIGADDFDLEITFATGRKQIQHIRVPVANDPAAGQGI